MGSKLSVCADCGAKFTNGIKYSYGGKFYCFDCYQKLQEKLMAAEDEKKRLYDYIKSLFSTPELPPEVVSAIDHEIDKGRKATGLYLTVKYYYEIQEHPRDKVVYVPYVLRHYYESARAYEKNIRELSKTNAKVVLTDDVRKVVLKQGDLERHVKKPKYDINNL